MSTATLAIGSPTLALLIGLATSLATPTHASAAAPQDSSKPQEPIALEEPDVIERRARNGRRMTRAGNALLIGGGLTLGLSGVATWRLVSGLQNGGYPGPYVIGIGTAGSIGLASIAIGAPLWFRGRQLKLSAGVLPPLGECRTANATEGLPASAGVLVLSGSW